MHAFKLICSAFLAILYIVGDANAARSTNSQSVVAAKSRSAVSSARDVDATTRNSTGRADAAIKSRATSGTAGVSARATSNVSNRSRAVMTRGGAGVSPVKGPALVSSQGVVSRSVGTNPRRLSVNRNASIIARNAAVAVDNVDVVTSIEDRVQMSEFCKTQYAACMDNFCNVLDDNMGRCSCSKNIKNYEKTEVALKEASAALQEIAQQIQYLGLSTDQVNALFSATEAELAMSASGDNTQLKNDLDRIKSMIVDVKTGTASSSAAVGSSLSMDLSGLFNFDLDSSGMDLGTLFGSNKQTADTSSISNQRGEQLYKTAVARCKAAVLTDCQNQGVDISIVTNSYDMEIDKSCIAYENNLKDSNEQMAQTVRNATGVLQRARLMLAQQKNAYDLRECVNALDSCMQNDFVCGSDYENCLDPTGKYIVNGEVIVGSEPGAAMSVVTGDTSTGSTNFKGIGLYDKWNYSTDSKNAWSKDGSVADYLEDVLKGIETTDLMSAQGASGSMAAYLMSKIGYADENGKSYGMCISVLNQCQDYTYEKGAYKVDNQVVREYLQRTLVQIKTAQDEVLSEYAEDCINDVTNCLSTNGFETTSLNTATELSPKNQIAINACNAQILTCMSVNNVSDDKTLAADSLSKKVWVLGIISDSGSAEAIKRTTCLETGGAWIKEEADSNGVTTYRCDCSRNSATYRTERNEVTEACGCKEGETLTNGVCSCPDGQVRSTSGDDAGQCVASSSGSGSSGETEADNGQQGG